MKFQKKLELKMRKNATYCEIEFGFSVRFSIGSTGHSCAKVYTIYCRFSVFFCVSVAKTKWKNSAMTGCFVGGKRTPFYFRH